MFGASRSKIPCVSRHVSAWVALSQRLFHSLQWHLRHFFLDWPEDKIHVCFPVYETIALEPEVCIADLNYISGGRIIRDGRGVIAGVRKMRLCQSGSGALISENIDCCIAWSFCGSRPDLVPSRADEQLAVAEATGQHELPPDEHAFAAPVSLYELDEAAEAAEGAASGEKSRVLPSLCLLLGQLRRRCC